VNSGVESVVGMVVASGAEREAEVEHPVVLCARVSVGLFRPIDGRPATCSRDPGTQRWYGIADRHTAPRAQVKRAQLTAVECPRWTSWAKEWSLR
jgi:hypothetical protein